MPQTYNLNMILIAQSTAPPVSLNSSISPAFESARLLACTGSNASNAWLTMAVISMLNIGINGKTRAKRETIVERRTISARIISASSEDWKSR